MALRDDRDLLARTIQAEAGNQGYDGKYHVGSVIRNRVEAGGYGDGYRGVIMKPGQFSAWNSVTGYAGGEQGQDMDNLHVDQESFDVADKIISDSHLDTTGGATHYYEPTISDPNWGARAGGTWTRRGDHLFGRGDDEPGRRKPSSVIEDQPSEVVQPSEIPDDFWSSPPPFVHPEDPYVPEEEKVPEGMWRLDLPDGDRVNFEDSWNREDALEWAKKEYPRSFGIVPEPPPPPVEDVNMAEAFLGSVAKALVTIPSGFASEFALATDNQELFDTAESWREYGGELQESISPSAGMVSIEDWENAWEESAVDGSLLWLEAAGEQLGASLGYFAPALLAGAAATYALPALGLGAMGTAAATTTLAASRLKNAAAAARSVTQLGWYLGANIERGVSEGLLSPEDYNGFEQLGYASGSAALDNLSFNVATGRGFVSATVKKLLGRGTGKLSVGANQAVAKSYLDWMNSIDTDGKIRRAVSGVLSEVVGETGQQELERAAAGLSVTNQEALDEVIDTWKMLAGPTLLTGGFGAAHAAYQDRQKKRQEEGYVEAGPQIAEGNRAAAKAQLEAVESDRVDELEAEARRANLAFDVDRAQATVTKKEIHEAADARNIRWDNDPGFLAFTSRILGKPIYHLDQITEPTDFLKVYNAVRSLPVQQTKTSFNVASDADVIDVARNIYKNSRKKKGKGKGRGKNPPVNRERIKRALLATGRVDPKKVRKPALKKIIRAYERQMAALGLLGTDPETGEKFVKAGSPGEIRPPIPVDQYNTLIDMAQEANEFPTFAQFESLTGIINREFYEDTVDSAITRGDITESNGKLVPAPGRAQLQTKYAVTVDGVQEPRLHDTLESANRRSAEIAQSQTQERIDRSSSRTGWTPRRINRLVPSTQVTAVDVPRRNSEVVREYNHPVESSTKWVVTDSATGQPVGSYDSRKKADAKQAELKAQGTWVVYRDNAADRAFVTDVADKKDKVTKQGADNFIKSSVTNAGVAARNAVYDAEGYLDNGEGMSRDEAIAQGISPKTFVAGRGVIPPNVVNKARVALKRAEAAEQKSLKKRKSEKLYGVDEQSGFTVSETSRTELEGKPQKPRIMGFFPTRSEANAASAALDRKVSGGDLGSLKEVVVDLQAERALNPELEQISDAELEKRLSEDPRSVGEEMYPVTEENATPAKTELMNEVKAYIDKEYPQSYMKGIIVEILDPEHEALSTADKKGSSFDWTSRIIRLVMSEDHKYDIDSVTGKKTQRTAEQIFKSLLGEFTHEKVHGFVRSGMIPKGVYKLYSQIAMKQEYQDSGLTYLQMAHRLYGPGSETIDPVTGEEIKSQGEKERWVPGDYMEEAVAFLLQDGVDNPSVLKGQARASFGRLAKTLDSIRNVFRGLGYKTTDDVLVSLYGNQHSNAVMRDKIADIHWIYRHGTVQNEEFRRELRDRVAITEDPSKLGEINEARRADRLEQLFSAKKQSIKASTIAKIRSRTPGLLGTGELSLPEATVDGGGGDDEAVENTRLYAVDRFSGNKEIQEFLFEDRKPGDPAPIRPKSKRKEIKDRFKGGEVDSSLPEGLDEAELVGLNRVGMGSARRVFDLGDGRVLKVAVTNKGLEQNRSIGFGDASILGRLIPEQYERGLDYVVMENVPRNDTAVRRWLSKLQEAVYRKSDFIGDAQEIMRDMGIEEFLNYEILWGDFVRPDSWGQRADGSFVLIDEGALNTRVHSGSIPSDWAVKDWNDVRSARKRAGWRSPTGRYSVDREAALGRVWNKPSSEFSSLLGVEETVGEWLDRHKVEETDDGRFVFYYPAASYDHKITGGEVFAPGDERREDLRKWISNPLHPDRNRGMIESGKSLYVFRKDAEFNNEFSNDRRDQEGGDPTPWSIQKVYLWPNQINPTTGAFGRVYLRGPVDFVEATSPVVIDKEAALEPHTSNRRYAVDRDGMPITKIIDGKKFKQLLPSSSSKRFALDRGRKLGIFYSNLNLKLDEIADTLSKKEGPEAKKMKAPALREALVRKGVSPDDLFWSAFDDFVEIIKEVTGSNYIYIEHLREGLKDLRIREEVRVLGESSRRGPIETTSWGGDEREVIDDSDPVFRLGEDDIRERLGLDEDDSLPDEFPVDEYPSLYEFYESYTVQVSQGGESEYYYYTVLMDHDGNEYSVTNDDDGSEISTGYYGDEQIEEDARQRAIDDGWVSDEEQIDTDQFQGTDYMTGEAESAKNYFELLLQVPDFDLVHGHYGGETVVHGRGQELTSADGELNVAAIDEIQSDHHQQGGTRGYDDDPKSEPDTKSLELIKDIHESYSPNWDLASIPDDRIPKINIGGIVVEQSPDMPSGHVEVRLIDKESGKAFISVYYDLGSSPDAGGLTTSAYGDDENFLGVPRSIPGGHFAGYLASGGIEFKSEDTDGGGKLSAIDLEDLLNLKEFGINKQLNEIVMEAIKKDIIANPEVYLRDTLMPSRYRTNPLADFESNMVRDRLSLDVLDWLRNSQSIFKMNSDKYGFNEAYEERLVPPPSILKSFANDVVLGIPGFDIRRVLYRVTDRAGSRAHDSGRINQAIDVDETILLGSTKAERDGYGDGSMPGIPIEEFRFSIKPELARVSNKNIPEVGSRISAVHKAPPHTDPVDVNFRTKSLTISRVKSSLIAEIKPPAKARSGIKYAPFADESTDLMAKRLLYKAIDEGLDGLVWTKGVQQVERYSKELRRTIDSVKYSDELPGKEGPVQRELLSSAGSGPTLLGGGLPPASVVDRSSLPAYELLEDSTGGLYDQSIRNKKELLGDKGLPYRQVEFVKNGTNKFDLLIRHDGTIFEVDRNRNHDWVGSSLGDVVGHEVANKILKSDTSGEIINKDLTVGGQLYTDLYDARLVKLFNEIGKIFGVKVTKIDVKAPNGETVQMWFLPITEKMRQSVKATGLPLFGRAFTAQGEELVSKNIVERGEKDFNTLMRSQEGRNIVGRYGGIQRDPVGFIFSEVGRRKEYGKELRLPSKYSTRDQRHLEDVPGESDRDLLQRRLDALKDFTLSDLFKMVDAIEEIQVDRIEEASKLLGIDSIEAEWILSRMSERSKEAQKYNDTQEEFFDILSDALKGTPGASTRRYAVGRRGLSVEAGVLDKGRKEKTGDYALDEDIPRKPGTSPIPNGNIRFFHYSNIRGESPNDVDWETFVHNRANLIRENGIQISNARGETYGEPNQIWASREAPDNVEQIYVEFSLPPDDPRIGGTIGRRTGTVDEIQNDRSDATFTGSIEPGEVVAVHEPWHNRARYIIEDNPGLHKDVIGGEYDYLLEKQDGSLNDYAAAVRRAKDVVINSKTPAARRYAVNRDARKTEYDSSPNPPDQRELATPFWKLDLPDTVKRGDGTTNLNKQTFGSIKYKFDGARLPKKYNEGRGIPVVVPYGKFSEGPSGDEISGFGFGERKILAKHGAEFPAKTIPEHETYQHALRGLLSAISEKHKNKQDTSGDVFFTGVESKNRLIVFWDDAEFSSPVIAVLDYRPAADELIWMPERYELVSLFTSDKFNEENLPNNQWNSPKHGRSVSVLAMKIFDEYRRPDAVRAFEAKVNRQRPAGERRFAVDRSSLYNTPAQQGAINHFMGEVKTSRSFIGNIIAGMAVNIGPDRIQKFRRAILDEVNQMKVVGKKAEASRRKDRRIGLDEKEQASVSAHAMGLLTSRAGALAQAALKYGFVKFTKLSTGADYEGSVLVEEQDLTETSEGTLYYDKSTGKYERGSFTSSGLYPAGKGGLGVILAPLGGPDNNLLPRFWTYARALRVKNLLEERPGIRVPMLEIEEATGKAGEDAIKEALAFAKENPEIAVAHYNLQRFNKGMVDFLVDTGAIDQKMADVWLKNADYIPFYLNLDGKMTDEMQEIFRRELGASADFLIIDSLIPQLPKKLKGHDGATMDPMESLVANTNALITAGLKNLASRRAIRDMVEVGTAAPQAGQWGGNRVVRVFENGKPTYYEVKDPIYFDTLVGIWDGKNPAVGALQSFGVKGAQLLREGVTHMPDFIAANTTRDAILTWINHGVSGNYTPMGELADSFKRLVSETIERQKGNMPGETYKSLEMAGALGGIELKDVTDAKIVSEFNRSVGSVDGLLKKTWNLLGDMSQSAEAAARERVQERVYDEVLKELLDKNMPLEEASKHAMAEAGFQAQEILNFSRHGASAEIRLLTSVIPFLNARIQGLDVFARNALSGENVLRADSEVARNALWQRGALIAGATVIYALMKWDDEDYNTRSLHERENNWIFNIGGFVLSIPIPFEAGIVFKAMPEHAVRLMMGETSSELLEAATHHMAATMQFNPIPQVVKPVLETAMNKSFFHQGDIIPPNLQNLDPKLQYRGSTSAASRILEKLVPDFIPVAGKTMNPLMIDNLLKGYFGSAATVALGFSDIILHRPLFGFTDRATRMWSEQPILKRFLKDEIGRGNEAAFYKLKEESDAAVRTVNILTKQSPKEVAAYRKEAAGILRIRGWVNNAHTQMKNIRHLEVANEYSDRSPDEKARIKALLKRRKSDLTSKAVELRRELDSY